MEGVDPGGPLRETEIRQGRGSWTVWRQDDNGNQYVVSRHDTRAEADAVAAMMETRGHKQTYWVARSA